MTLPIPQMHFVQDDDFTTDQVPNHLKEDQEFIGEFSFNCCGDPVRSTLKRNSRFSADFKAQPIQKALERTAKDFHEVSEHMQTVLHSNDAERKTRFFKVAKNEEDRLERGDKLSELSEFYKNPTQDGANKLVEFLKKEKMHVLFDYDKTIVEGHCTGSKTYSARKSFKLLLPALQKAGVKWAVASYNHELEKSTAGPQEILRGLRDAGCKSLNKIPIMTSPSGFYFDYADKGQEPDISHIIQDKRATYYDAVLQFLENFPNGLSSAWFGLPNPKAVQQNLQSVELRKNFFIARYILAEKIDVDQILLVDDNESNCLAATKAGAYATQLVVSRKLEVEKVETSIPDKLTAQITNIHTAADKQESTTERSDSSATTTAFKSEESSASASEENIYVNHAFVAEKEGHKFLWGSAPSQDDAQIGYQRSIDDVLSVTEMMKKNTDVDFKPKQPENVRVDTVHILAEHQDFFTNPTSEKAINFAKYLKQQDMEILFDYDGTIVDRPSFGKFKSAQLRDSFKILLPELEKQGVPFTVASYNHESQCGAGGGDHRNGIGGPSVIWQGLQKAGVKDPSKVPIMTSPMSYKAISSEAEKRGNVLADYDAAVLKFRNEFPKDLRDSWFPNTPRSASNIKSRSLAKNFFIATTCLLKGKSVDKVILVDDDLKNCEAANDAGALAIHLETKKVDQVKGGETRILKAKAMLKDYKPDVAPLGPAPLPRTATDPIYENLRTSQ